MSQLKTLQSLPYMEFQTTCPTSPEEKEACLLVLTTDGFLKVLSADSGKVLKTVFLSTIVKYR